MPRAHFSKAGGDKPNRIPKEWRQHAKSRFPNLKNYWFKQYVLQNPGEFELSSLEEAPNRGADFRGDYGGKSVLIKIARDYVFYLSSDHPNCRVLVVGVLEPPLPAMFPHLPDVIINLDPQKVVDWSKGARDSYRADMDERRKSLPEQWELVRENMDFISEVRVKEERLEVVLKAQMECECGGIMVEGSDSFDLIEELTDGQLADYMAGIEAPSDLTPKLVSLASRVQP